MRKGRENFLDYIPVRNPRIFWELNKAGNVELEVEHRGFFHRIAQIFFQRPRVSRIELDVMGSFLWQQMDGKTDVYGLGKNLKEKFGEKAEPLYTRLCNYVKILKNYKFIQLLRG